MRRKLVKQGKGALTLSLPSRWIREQQLKPGDELIIDERDTDLVLRTEGKKPAQTTSIELDFMSPEAYRSILGGLYRGGYDSIEVMFDDRRVLQNLEKAANSIYGFEVFYVSEQKCTVRTIYDDENTDISMHIDRMIYTIQTMQQIIENELKAGTRSAEQELLQLRNNVLKQRDLIVRVIRKKRLLGNDAFPYYTISLSLWGAARNYHHMYADLAGKQKVEILEKTNRYFRDSFKKIRSMDMDDYLARHKRYTEVYKACTDKLEGNPLASYCMSIVLQVQLADSSIFLLNHRDQ